MYRTTVNVVIVGSFFAGSLASTQAQSSASATSSGIASSITSRSSTFRPTPLRGQSQIPGRSMSLRDQMSQNRIYLMTPATNSVSSIAQILQQSAQSRATIRAAQARSSQVAALSLRQASVAPRVRHQVSHVVELAVDPVQPSERFESLQSGERARRMANVQDRLGVTDLQIQSAGSTVVLKGTIASEQRKRLFERILLLEPGVDAVDNQLIVVSP